MKKRMFLSTILMTLVLLLAVTTATFAWYKAEQGNVDLTSTDTASLTANTTTVTLGAVTFTVEFGSVTEGTKPTYTSDAFAGTALTDGAGVSKYWTGSAAVPYEATNKVGVAKATVTASVAEGENLSAALVNLYGSGKTTVVLTIKAGGQVTVEKAEADLFDEESPLSVANTITFELALDANGTTSSWNSNFYYATRTNAAGGEESPHNADSISASLA